LLPAIQAAREAARRTQCTNNLKQIGLAILTMADIKEHLPASRIDCHHGTWATELWPYLENQNLANLWDTVAPFHFQPEEAIQAQVPSYYCPSRRAPPQLSQPNCEEFLGVAHRDAALSDYAGVVGTNSKRWDYWDNPPYPNGSFVYNKCKCEGSRPLERFRGKCTYYIKLKMFTDGLSRTVLLGEKHVPVGLLGQKDGLDCSVYNPDVLVMFGRFAGEDFPLARSQDEGSQPKVEPMRSNFGSWHPGICQFVFGDGRVEQIQNEIDPLVLGLLANREDGESDGYF
jgi:hypothetical protein